MHRVSALVIILMVAGGLRLVLDLALPGRDPVPLAAPFEPFGGPGLGEDWERESQVLSDDVVGESRVTDYLYHLYRKPGEGRLFWLYVGYVDHWDPEAIHHPKVCFPSAGLDLVEVGEIDLPVTLPSRAAAGGEESREIRFNELVSRDSRGQSLYTLYTFYYRGKFEPSQRRMHADRVLGIPYFAIITISGPLVGGSLEDTRAEFRESVGTLIPQVLTHFRSPVAPEADAG